MRIAVIGAGGIGALLGASLANAGEDVIFLARGAHLAAMKRNGLRIEGDRGPSIVRDVRATDNAAEVGHVDLVLFCVKLWDVESAGEQIRSLIGKETQVIPLQNGIDASERLAPILGAGHVLGGVAVVTGAIVSPGVVRQSGTHHSITFGELDGGTSPRLERIRATCQAAGIDTKLTQEIQRERWEKFVVLVAASGVCALTRRAIGELRDDPDIWPLFGDAMAEVVAVGQACGIDLSPDIVPSRLAFLRSVPSNWMPSMAVDLHAGNRLELPWLAGKVVQLGRERNVPTPVNRVISAALKPFAAGTANRS
jgi:2-dehydropantoate 2-reductase